LSILTRGLVCRNHIDLILNTKVKAVQRHSVTVSDASGAESQIPFGACVWATGVAMHPVIKQVSLLCCAVLCWAGLGGVELCCAVPCYVVMCWAVLCCAAQVVHALFALRAVACGP